MFIIDIQFILQNEYSQTKTSIFLRQHLRKINNDEMYSYSLL